MNKFFCLIFLFLPVIGHSSEKADTTGSGLKAECNISINSNGIASVPSFSLGRPAVIASVGISKGRLSYDPVLAYDLQFKPWFIDSWIHWKLVKRPSFMIRTGINFSNFFSKLDLHDEEILQGQRYWAFEIAGFYYPSPKTTLSLMYWSDRGQDPGTIIGNYISLLGEKTGIRAGKNFLFSAGLQLFYIDYEGKNDGLFVSPKISLSLRDYPFSVFFQATQPVFSNISPFPGFKWNIGFLYTL